MTRTHTAEAEEAVELPPPSDINDTHSCDSDAEFWSVTRSLSVIMLVVVMVVAVAHFLSYSQHTHTLTPAVASINPEIYPGGYTRWTQAPG